MRVAIFIIAALIFAAMVGELSITFKPFSISLPYWRTVVAIILIYLGLHLFYADSYLEGVKWGTKETIEQLKELSKKHEDGL